MKTKQTLGVEQAPVITANRSFNTHRNSVNNNNIMTIGTKPTLIANPAKYPMRFLIMDAPRQANLHLYIKEMRKQHVTDVVRVCEKTYASAELQAAGIAVHEMEYPDGHSPPQDVIDKWLELIDARYYDKTVVPRTGAGGKVTNGATATASTTVGHVDDEQPATLKQSGQGVNSAPSSALRNSMHDDGGGNGNGGSCIAVHCVAGLGRAPVMVAIALIEFADMDPVEAVTLIRRHRRGAINEKQLLYLEGYKKSYYKKKKRRHGGSGGAAAGDGGCGCVVM